MTDIVAKPEDASSTLFTSGVSSTGQTVHQSPGAALKEAREHARLSTTQVAEALNWKHSVVIQLEADDYAALPGPTFIRGYLRAYGKLVELSPEVLIEGYNQSAGELEMPEQRFKPVETIKPQRNFSDPLIKYTTLIIVAALIALSVIWWQSRNGAETLGLSKHNTIEVETSNGETIIAKMDLGSADRTDSAEVIESTPRELDTDATATSDLNSEPSVISQEESDTGAESDGEVVALSDKPEQEGSFVQNTQTAISGESGVLITFTQECWVEVTDARGIKVVANLKKAGEQSLATGVAPFKVMIGNAEGAQLTYLGEVVDLKPHTNRNGIARLTLGQ